MQRRADPRLASRGHRGVRVVPPADRALEMRSGAIRPETDYSTILTGCRDWVPPSIT